jgi:hypothetical protein
MKEKLSDKITGKDEAMYFLRSDSTLRHSSPSTSAGYLPRSVLKPLHAGTRNSASHFQQYLTAALVKLNIIERLASDLVNTET